jgi:hypothetical protein
MRPLTRFVAPAVVVAIIATAALPSFSQSLVIAEFMASNQSSIRDEDGDYEDWIELLNQGTVAVNLEGWFLTDNATNLNKWAFPDLTLNPNERLLVFASAKDRQDPDSTLHTNFKLASEGEYLAIVRPDGLTVEQHFSPSFPLQAQDISYGLQQITSATTLIGSGAAIRYQIPSTGEGDVLEGTNADSWIATEFPDSQWSAGSAAIGYATGSPDAYDLLIETDVEEQMFGEATSVYIRIPFTAPDPSSLSALNLKMKWDDGFVAYLNGNPLPIAEENAPSTDELNYQSSATASHSDSQAVVYDNYDISPSLLSLGENVLCIHGLNVSTGSSDFLIVPELEALSSSGTSTPAYFAVPSPNAPNNTGNSLVGPLIRNVTRNIPPITLATATPPVVADSAEEFSGNQGALGWFYGYQEGVGPYDPDTSFIPFAGGEQGGPWNGTTQEWSGSAWDANTSASSPWTSLEATSMHPNDSNPGPEQYPIRRWVSDTSGLHTIAGTFHNLSASGDGTTGRVFHEGNEVFSQLTDGGPVDFSIIRNLNEGDRLDFLVDSGPFDQDGSDGTDQTVTIYEGSFGTTSVVIEAEVLPTMHPVEAVSLIWRVMYDQETTSPMLDDGSGGDAFAGDGIYTATISTSDLSRGEMLRWKVLATDTAGVTAKQPQFPDPRDSPEYFGTIAADASVTNSNLPIFHWFTSNPGGANTTSGSRGSVYYLGEFYDNIQADRHGQSTGGFPKKSYDFDFNKSNRFLFQEGEGRVKDINMLTNWADKSKTRNTLGYEMVRRSGEPAHFAFPVRIQQNGSFFSVADMVEDGDDRYLDRVGLDPEGALYKMYNRLDSSSSGINKKTRKNENNRDLQDLITGLGLSGEARLRYGYDNIDIPGTINYLAALDLTNNRDHGHKNYYLYRDTLGTGEWRPLVWDIDLCLGRNWVSGPAYFDDTFTNNNLRAGASNRLKTFVFNDTTLNQMYLRRVRTLMDQLIGPASSPVSYLPDRVDELTALIDPNDNNAQRGNDDADLDYRKWGSWGNRNTLREAANRIKIEHIPGRRNQLYGLSEIPAGQPETPVIRFGTVDYNPAARGASPDQRGEYFLLVNPNRTAIDCSNWEVSGGISFSFPAGTVIPARGRLNVARDARGFRERSISPKAGERRYLISGYDGQLSARGETLTLKNEMGVVIDTLSYPGSPTPGQDFLRISEILFAPAPPTESELAIDPTLTAEDFEFVELTNTGSIPLDISGASFVEGISLSFPPQTILAAGQHILVVANLAAFNLRYQGADNVAGEYTGKLSNDGEQLQILDAEGENILEFSYNDAWYDATDDAGHSLVARNPAITPITDFDRPANWGVSLEQGGDPGISSSTFAVTFSSWKYQNFSEESVSDPAISGGSVDLDADTLNTVMEYGFGRNPTTSDADNNYRASLVEHNGTDYLALSFRRQKDALDLSYEVQFSNDLISWIPSEETVGEPRDNGDGTETVTIRDQIPASGNSTRYTRVRIAIGQ